MWLVDYTKAPPPFTVSVEVCGKPLRMEVDTGASVSVIAKSRLLQLLPSIPVQPSQVFLRSYSGDLKKVQGKADVHVKFHGKEAHLPIFLAGNESPTLLGRNWMQELGIGVSDVEVNIHALADVKHVVQDYTEVFEEGLGTFKGATASLHVPSDAPPRFLKPRPLPYALTDEVTQEIQRLIRDSIIVPVKTARWAAPIVPVTKRDGRIRICGDFGVTINPVATVERYPIPRIEDLWTVLAGGEKFTKLDLRDAYQQVVLDEASRESLSKAEQNYSQLDKEALALVFGVDRFHQYLWGIPFEAHTDHKPLLELLGANKPVPVQASPRVVRWALKLSAYNYKLVYKPGKELGHADAPSRLPLPNDCTAFPRPAEIFMLEEAYPQLLSPAVVARATRDDPVLSHVVLSVLKGESLPAGPEWKPFSARSAEISLHEGCLLWGSRVVIPKKLLAQVLGVLHASHPGIEKSKMIARSHVWWPGIDNDIANSVKSCATCQAQHRAAQPVQQTPWPFPQRPWSRLHIDFGGPFLGHTFLVIVDAFSKWIEVFPVSSTSADATISALRMAFAQHGLPDIIVSDNGPAFTSAQYLDFLTRNGIRRMLVPPYHPASNGAAERAVQTVKNKLKKSRLGNFQTQLSRFLFHYRTTPHEVTGRPPCELLTGRAFKTPLDVLRPSLQTSVLVRQLKQKLYADRGSRPAPSLQPGDSVYARNFRQGAPWVRASVVDITPPSASVILDDRSIWHRHGDHLRLAQTGPPGTSETDALHRASAAAIPQWEQPPLRESTVPDMPEQEAVEPSTSSPERGCAINTDITASNSGVHVGSDSSVAAPCTPVLRRSNRSRKPVLRYSP
ncbi:uncharacterized protein K02A2.6-like [Rhipicephalus sanguineus]|uniref:uncharacterized protein K02A2.6-like n=1 Tax=Rhipicephalus sanguineus TaxID=34632 RepID=UPI001895DC57|nr:uncharacterized protein K02A2.6-like [Rhipicephalus sanguineus]